MERQPRNIIGLLTLFIAALGSVAVIGSEHHRSTVNTAILVVAAVAAVGSLLALVLGPVTFSVLKKDVRKLRDARPGRKWATRHYLAQESDDVKTERMMAFFTPSVKAIRAQGLPCMIAAVEPRTLGTAEERPAKGASLSCAVERREHPWRFGAQRVDVTPSGDDAWGGVARWPDRWFDPEHGAPSPGRYRVRWKIRFPDGKVERATERVRVVAEGDVHVGRLSRAAIATRRVIDHYRGLD